MTDITPLIARNAQVIQGYGQGFIKVSGQVYETPILVMPSSTVIWSGLDTDLMTLSDFEILLLGVGNSFSFQDFNRRQQLREAGVIGVEIMETAAACRTFNVLMAEGRRVIAALIPSKT